MPSPTIPPFPAGLPAVRQPVATLPYDHPAVSATIFLYDVGAATTPAPVALCVNHAFGAAEGLPIRPAEHAAAIQAAVSAHPSGVYEGLPALLFFWDVDVDHANTVAQYRPGRDLWPKVDLADLATLLRP